MGNLLHGDFEVSVFPYSLVSTSKQGPSFYVVQR